MVVTILMRLEACLKIMILSYLLSHLTTVRLQMASKIQRGMFQVPTRSGVRQIAYSVLELEEMGRPIPNKSQAVALTHSIGALTYGLLFPGRPAFRVRAASPCALCSWVPPALRFLAPPGCVNRSLFTPAGSFPGARGVHTTPLMWRREDHLSQTPCGPVPGGFSVPFWASRPPGVSHQCTS